jgi:hypothetical protein
MNAAKKSKRPPAPGAPPYRTAGGVVAAWIDEIGPGEYRAWTMTEGGQIGRRAIGSTPRQAIALLHAQLGGEPTVAGDKATAALLRAPIKRPGQNPGGPPLKRAEKATDRFTVRIPAALKARLQARAEARGTSPGQYLLDALEAELLRDAEDRPRPRSRAKPRTSSIQ